MKRTQRYATWMFYMKDRLHPLWAGTGITRRKAFQTMLLIHGLNIEYNRDIKSEFWN